MKDMLIFQNLYADYMRIRNEAQQYDYEYVADKTRGKGCAYGKEDKAGADKGDNG